MCFTRMIRLCFCGASQDPLTRLSWLLMWFEAISGLRINLNASEFFPVRRVENVEELAKELGCKVGGSSLFVPGPHSMCSTEFGCYLGQG